MIMMRWAVLIAACGEAVVCAQPVDQPQQHNLAQQNQARNRDGYFSAQGKTYIHIPGIPIPIQPGDVERWGAMMELSEGQAKILGELYAKYTLSEEQIHREVVQPLWDRSAQLRTQFVSQPPDVDTALQYVELFEKTRKSAVAKLVANERVLLSEFAIFLADEQQRSLQHVESQRSRDRATRRGVFFPAGGLDLTLLIDLLRRQGFDTVPENRVQYESALDTYDSQVTTLFISALDAAIERDGRSMLLLAQAEALHHAGGDEQRREQMRVQWESLHSTVVRFERQIHDVNRQSVEIIGAALPAATRSALRKAFLELAYPPVYPDPTDLEQWFEAVLATETLLDERRAAIMTYRSEAQGRQEQLCDDLVEQYKRYREIHGLGIPGYSFGDYEQVAMAIHQRRVEYARSIVKTVQSTLTDPERIRLQPHTHALEERLTTPFTPDRTRKP